MELAAARGGGVDVMSATVKVCAHTCAAMHVMLAHYRADASGHQTDIGFEAELTGRHLEPSRLDLLPELSLYCVACQVHSSMLIAVCLAAQERLPAKAIFEPYEKPAGNTINDPAACAQQAPAQSTAALPQAAAVPATAALPSPPTAQRPSRRDSNSRVHFAEEDNFQRADGQQGSQVMHKASPTQRLHTVSASPCQPVTEAGGAISETWVMLRLRVNRNGSF